MTAWRHFSVGGMVLALTILIGGGMAAAGPLDAPGYTKAFACSACHGFAGKRPAAEMEPYAKMVKELGVEDVAGYFAAQKKEATPLAADAAAGDAGLRQLKAVIRPIPEATLADIAAYYSSLK